VGELTGNLSFVFNKIWQSAAKPLILEEGSETRWLHPRAPTT